MFARGHMSYTFGCDNCFFCKISRTTCTTIVMQDINIVLNRDIFMEKKLRQLKIQNWCYKNGQQNSDFANKNSKVKILY
jgi:hypothetical protein